jgi:hypothetical protein
MPGSKRLVQVTRGDFSFGYFRTGLVLLGQVSSCYVILCKDSSLLVGYFRLYHVKSE